MNSTEGTPLLNENVDVGFEKARTIAKNPTGRESVSNSKSVSHCHKPLFLLSGVLLQVLVLGIWYGLAVMMPELVRVFHAGRTEVALIMTSYVTVLHVGGLTLTYPMQRFGDCQCALVGVIIGAFGLIVSSLATNLITIIVMIGVISGWGLSCVYLMPYNAFVEVFKEKASDKLIYLVIAISVAQFLFPWIFDEAISEYGWQGCLLIGSGLILQCLPCCAYINVVLKMVGGRENIDTKPSKLASLQHTLALFKDKTFTLILVLFFLTPSIANFEVLFIGDFLQSRGYARHDGSFVVSMMGVTNFVSRVLAIVILKKWRFPTIYHWCYMMPAVSLGHIAVALSSNYWVILTACLWVMIFCGVIISQDPVVTLETVGEDKYHLAWAVGMVIFGARDLFHGEVAGAMKDVTGDYVAMLFLIVALCFLGGLISLTASLMMRTTRIKQIIISN